MKPYFIYPVAILLLTCCTMPVTLMAKDFTVSLFGIKSDGITLNTRSIQYGIDYVSKCGGGRLVFPKGEYLTGTIYLKSEVLIHLEEGAVLLGSVNPLDYDQQPVRFDRNKTVSAALLFGINQENIGITGKGTIEGQGLTVANNTKETIRKGFISDPLFNQRPSESNRPMIIHLFACKNVTLKGVTLRNSACWVQAYNLCRNVWLDSIIVDSEAFWNNDGVDIIDCDSVRISNAFINVSDDGICLKTLENSNGCRRIIIQNNTISSGANAIKFGTASYGSFNGIRISNNRVVNTFRSAIALEAVDGGSIENAAIDSLYILNTGNAVFLRLGERIEGKKGRMANIRFHQLEAEITQAHAKKRAYDPGDIPPNASTAIIIAGLPAAMIADIEFRNIKLELPRGVDSVTENISGSSPEAIPENSGSYPEFSMFGELPAWGIYIRHAYGIRFTGLSLKCATKDYRTAIVIDDAGKTGFRGLKIQEPGSKKRIYAIRSSGISIK